MIRSFFIIILLNLQPSGALANPSTESKESDFLDLVDNDNHVLVQGRGVEDINRQAQAQGLKFPALGYWSPEGHCFVEPAPGDCNGVFQR